MNAKEARRQLNDRIENKKREAISQMLPMIYSKIEIAIENCLNSVTVELENEEECLKFSTCLEILKKEGYAVHNSNRLHKGHYEEYSSKKTQYKISW